MFIKIFTINLIFLSSISTENKPLKKLTVNLKNNSVTTKKDDNIDSLFKEYKIDLVNSISLFKKLRSEFNVIYEIKTREFEELKNNLVDYVILKAKIKAELNDNIKIFNKKNSVYLKNLKNINQYKNNDRPEIKNIVKLENNIYQYYNFYEKNSKELQINNLYVQGRPIVKTIILQLANFMINIKNN